MCPSPAVKASTVEDVRYAATRAEPPVAHVIETAADVNHPVGFANRAGVVFADE